MKFNCARDDLRRALNLVRHGVASRTTLKTLEGILFRIKKDQLELESTDLKLGIKTAIPVDAEEEGEAVVNAQLILEIVSKLSDPVVYFESDKKGRMTVECGRANYTLNTLKADEFPVFPVPENQKTVQVDARTFKSLIDSTRFAVAKNENIPMITGIKLEAEGEQIRMVAIDGFRLAVKSEELLTPTDEKIEVTVPGKSMQDISSLLAGFHGPITLEFSPTQIFITIGDATVTSRLLDGEFIRYEDILPKETRSGFLIDRSELLRSCERVAIIAEQGSNNLLKMNITSGKLTIESNSEDGKVEESLDIENRGSDLLIAFNSKFIIEALKAIRDENVKVELTNSVGPVEFLPEENDDYIYLILPVRLPDS